jgi:hypothetical protein
MPTTISDAIAQAEAELAAGRVGPSDTVSYRRNDLRLLVNCICDAADADVNNSVEAAIKRAREALEGTVT